MEREEHYQRVLSFLSQLEALQERLDDREVMKSCSEAAKQIVLQFDRCLVALAARKEHLLREVEKKLQAQREHIKRQQKELTYEIEGCKRILEGGSLLYNTNQEIAIAIWKNVTTLSIPNLEEGFTTAEFNSSLVDTIGTYGKVEVQLKRVTCNRAGYVSTLSVNRNVDFTACSPSAIYFNPRDDALFVCDTSNTIKRIGLKGGTIVTSKDTCQFRSLGGISFHHKTNTGYVVDKYSHSIKRLTSTWLGFRSELFVGIGNAGFRDGTGLHAAFNSPCDVTINQRTGDLYVSDLGNHCVRKITPNGNVTTLAGSGRAGFQDGFGRGALFKEPTGITLCTKSQSLYVCDETKIRVISIMTGEVKTIPKEFVCPYGIVVVADGTLLVTSFTEHKIMKVVLQGNNNYEVDVIVGSSEGNEDGIPGKCKLNGPTGITYDERTSTCYFADYGNRSIRKFSLV